MRTTLASRAYPCALGLVSVWIATLAYLLAQPGEHVRAPEPVAPDGPPRTLHSAWVELPSPDFVRLLLPLPGSELPPRGAIPNTLAVAPSPREKGLPPLDGSAIGEVIRANGGRVPATGAELRRALDRLGDFAQLPVPFSAVALDSGLVRPRVVMTQHPKSLADAPPDRPNLVGRLFLAANTVADGPTDQPRVNSVEFISWNSTRRRFDFGVIEGMGGTPELKILDGTACFSCHKTRGPILGVPPWSNTAHDATVRNAMRVMLLGIKDPGAKTERKLPDIDGLSLFAPRAMEVDTAVRLAGGMLRDREVFRALNQTPAGRQVFTRMLVALTKTDSLATADAAIEVAVAQTDLSQFGTAAAAIYRSAASTRLVDFDPSESVLDRRGGGPWGGGNVDLVARYELQRATGKHGMTSAHLPSNPKAFGRPTAPNTFAGVAGVSVLARTIGLTTPDRRFLNDALGGASDTVWRLTNRPVPPSTLAARVFAGPKFAGVVAGGELPDRDDFKDRFVAGLTEVLGRYGHTHEFTTPREYYTSGPRRGAGSEVAEAVPTTACLRCHDVRTSGRGSAFNPIPPLAFDPFDKISREAWVRSADPGKREAVLARMLKRMGTDRDMPPVDATEHALFREKNPASFDAVTAFLEAELRKARGR